MEVVYDPCDAEGYHIDPTRTLTSETLMADGQVSSNPRQVYTICRGGILKSRLITIGLDSYKLFKINATPLQQNFLNRRRALETKMKETKSKLNKSNVAQFYKTAHDEHMVCIKLMAAGLYGLINDIHSILDHFCGYSYCSSRFFASERYDVLQADEYTCTGHSLHLILPLNHRNRDNNLILQYLLPTFQDLHHSTTRPRKSERFTATGFILLGYVMIFGAEVLYSLLQKSNKVSKEMKSWSLEDIQRKGKKYYYRGSILAKDEPISGTFSSAAFYCRGQYQHYFLGDYDKAKMYYVMSIISSEDEPTLMDKVVAMIALSNICTKIKEYLIGWKIINTARRLCGKYFMKSFIEDEYDNIVINYCERVSELKCGYCERQNWQEPYDGCLKCCKGCMKEYYCNKRCQKRQWPIHKTECDMTWKHLYQSLKLCIFDCMM